MKLLHSLRLKWQTPDFTWRVFSPHIDYIYIVIILRLEVSTE